ncbi:pickpocket protein 28-like [Sitodiplosis mosellana]|uniref:pickpocket protein 28-like n=1 Tax=Sitodiplosis mosellana TaxID=263140 RepID=UPI0024440ED7|nr:pickpocket protein 28-like [Sitodiplosis mosellana]
MKTKEKTKFADEQTNNEKDNEMSSIDKEVPLPSQPHQGNSRLAGLASRVMKMKMKRRHSRYERPIYAFWELFSDYSEFSTIHGVRYMGEKKRHITERLWWLFVVLCSIVVCCILVYQTWLKWQNTPVIVTFSEESTPVYEIPFPTVTICTDIKMKQTKLNFTDVWHKLNKDGYKNATIKSEDLQMIHSLSPICQHMPAHFEEYIKLSGLINETDSDARFFTNAKQVAPSLNEILFRCTWHRQDVNCSDIFNEVLTDEGICFAFNYHNASEIYNEHMLDKSYHVTRHNKKSGYWNGLKVPNMTESDIYPYRVLSGSEGLRVDLRLFEFDIDYVCSGPVQSFKILLHSADEVPQMKKYYYRIPLDHDTVMAVRPNIMNTTERLIENYNHKERKCIVGGVEKQLIFFKKYTQRNCQLDNLAFRTTAKCKCVTFAMPRLPNIPICRKPSQLQCVKTVENSLMQQILNKTAISYNCLPACRSVSYDAEISMARLDRYNHQRAMGQGGKLQRKRRYTRVFISFKDEQFFSSRRAEVYTTIDFIANCGGILGLFMGISILSIVEIVYFSTLRLGCSLRKRRQNKQRRLQQLKILDEMNAGEQNEQNEQNNHSDYDNLPEMTY